MLTLQPIYGPRPPRKIDFRWMVDTVRINLSGLWVELLLRAIMGIRARLSSLTRWPRGPWLQSGFRRAG
jgi:hypothetical protein